MAKNGVQNVKIEKKNSEPCFPHNGPQMVEISKKNSEKKSLLEPSEVGWGMAKIEVFGHFCHFFGQVLWKSIMGPENAPPNFFCTVVRAGGSKMAIFLAKNGFFPPHFSYFWL